MIPTEPELVWELVKVPKLFSKLKIIHKRTSSQTNLRLVSTLYQFHIFDLNSQGIHAKPKPTIQRSGLISSSFNSTSASASTPPSSKTKQSKQVTWWTCLKPMMWIQPFKTLLGIGEFYNNNRKDLCIPSWLFVCFFFKSIIKKSMN